MSKENLKNKEAIEKLKELVDGIDIGMLSTFKNNTDYPHTIPMSRQEVDDEGNIWFLFSADSETFNQLQENNKVSLAYAHVGNYQFLSINGIAEISEDKARVEKYWNSFMEAWFEKGKDDANIRILKVVPHEAHYWDNKTNKLMTLLKVATSAITGQKSDIGREGDLDI